MSRSKKGKKSPGTDYWSKRPGTKKVDGPGKLGKKVNKRMERAIDKKLEKEDE